ncbi:MAG: hypothetical protein DDT32_02220 [Syntrophomonadaceae bacterium]|nr:hypothetical protein [Bacillota bacterium]
MPGMTGLVTVPAPVTPTSMSAGIPARRVAAAAALGLTMSIWPTLAKLSGATPSILTSPGPIRVRPNPSGKITVITWASSISLVGINLRVYTTPVRVITSSDMVTTVNPAIAPAGAAITAVRLATRARMVRTLSIRCFVFI